MNDLISRLSELRCQYNCFDEHERDAYHTLSEAIKAISAQPERRGKWQITDAYPHNVYCSECHTRFAQTHWAVWEDGSLPRNFCPNCGAKMEEKNG